MLKNTPGTGKALRNEVYEELRYRNATLIREGLRLSWRLFQV
jgi:hypothetical protein